MKKYIFNFLAFHLSHIHTHGAALTKVVNSVSVGVLFFQLKWNVSVSECFDVPFRSCTVHIYIYIYSTNIIQDKLIINYAIQTQCQTNIISKFKIFLNSQD